MREQTHPQVPVCLRAERGNVTIEVLALKETDRMVRARVGIGGTHAGA